MDFCLTWDFLNFIIWKKMTKPKFTNTNSTSLWLEILNFVIGSTPKIFKAVSDQITNFSKPREIHQQYFSAKPHKISRLKHFSSIKLSLKKLDSW